MGKLSSKVLQEHLSDFAGDAQAFLKQGNARCISGEATKDRSQLLSIYITKIRGVPYRLALFHSPAQSSRLRPIAIQNLALVGNLPAFLALFAPETEIQRVQQQHPVHRALCAIEK